MKDHDALNTIPLFHTLTGDERVRMGKMTHRGTFEKGFLLYEEGAEQGHLYAIIKGSVKTTAYDENGNDYTFAVHRAGEIFGELCLIHEDEAQENAETTEATDLLMIPVGEVRRAMAQNAAFGCALVTDLAHRLVREREQRKRHAFLTIDDRIMEYLADLGRVRGVRQNGCLIIEKGPSQVEIAGALGCQRETVSRMMTKLAAEGRVHRERHRYVIEGLT